MHLELPQNVHFIFSKLLAAGFESYLVGGCLRDLLRGKKPKDWDFTTAAEPQQILNLFPDLKINEKGLPFGTVTIIYQGKAFDISSFNQNVEKSEQTLVRNINLDLRRRDFTINALAYNHQTGLIDLFHGQNDLQKKIIKCIGIPEERFKEDPFRMMRAFRFASTLGFRVDHETQRAIFRNKDLTKNIPQPRWTNEFNKILFGNYSFRTLVQYKDLVAVIIPEINLVSPKTIDAMRYPSIGIVQRLVKLWYELDNIEAVLTRLQYPIEMINHVCKLIKYIKLPLSLDKIMIKKCMQQIGFSNFQQVLSIRKTLEYQKKKFYQDIESLVFEILQNGECYSIQQLAITKEVLMKEGVKETNLHTTLETILSAVIENRVINKQSAILKAKLF